jgi:hypothetical protein
MDSCFEVCKKEVWKLLITKQERLIFPEFEEIKKMENGEER